MLFLRDPRVKGRRAGRVFHGRIDGPGSRVEGVRTLLALAVGTALALALAAPAPAQEPGLGEASQAGRVTVRVDAGQAFTRVRAERSVRRALRRHGFTEVRADCTRERGVRVAECTVTATDGTTWSGTATVRPTKRAHVVEYLVRGGS